MSLDSFSYFALAVATEDGGMVFFFYKSLV